jgi:MoxR-like ATPase
VGAGLSRGELQEFIDRVRVEFGGRENTQARAAAEEAARARLDEYGGAMSQEQAFELGRLFNTSAKDGRTRYDRFSPAFHGASMQRLVEDIDAFNEWTARIWRSSEEDALAAFDEVLRDRSTFPNAGTSYPSMLMYLRDPTRYAVWGNATHQGLRRLTGYTGPGIGRPGGYMPFCDAAQEMRREFDLAPQEVDLVLAVGQQLPAVAESPEVEAGSAAWLFQANPSIYDIDRALQELQSIEWTLRRYRKRVEVGDRAYVWRSGSDGGVVAVGSVLTEAVEKPPDPLEGGYYLSAENFPDSEPRVSIGIDHVLARPLLKRALQEDPVLQDLPILRFANATVYPVSAAQSARLQELIEGGHRRYWWVNQGHDFAREREHGYVTSPLKDRGGGEPAHWKVLAELRPGDRILHYARRLQAVGEVVTAPTSGVRPEEVGDTGWGAEGHFVRVAYRDLEPTIDLSEIPLDWRREERGPFRSDGAVNQGYCFPLSDQFVRKVAERFPQLELVDDVLGRGSLEQTTPFSVHSILQAATREPRALLLDEATYAGTYAALQSGKHIVFTGPPGTAKTTLAEAVAEAATEAGLCSGHVLTTATADWTTYETIGGLKPTRGGQLTFASGHFLEAIERDQWLVIDELNRSNFDRAFGQLFTVLSGQAVQLPYEREGHAGRLVLAPQGAPVAEGADVIRIPESWRVIATMNVFDKSLLFEMSFALMRRFAFIEVPAPPDAEFEELVRRSAGSDPAAAELAMRFYPLRKFKDLGPALYMDMARFLAVRRAQEPSNDQQLAFEAFYSYLLPQFEGIDQATGEQLWTALKPLVGGLNVERLRKTLNAVLGLEIAASSSRQDEDEELAIVPDEAQIVQE